MVWRMCQVMKEGTKTPWAYDMPTVENLATIDVALMKRVS